MNTVRRRVIFLVVIVLCILTSCGSGKLTTTETKPTEAFVFGRLLLARDNTIHSKNVSFDFGKNGYIKLDEKGFFCAKLPLGENNIVRLGYKNKTKKLPKEYLSFNLANPNCVYYLGDIRILWSPQGKDQSSYLSFGFGLIGAAADIGIDALKKSEYIPVEMNHRDETVEYFLKLFPDNRKEIRDIVVTVTEKE